ncbi:unnamed protein product [Pedinophyceae sp. YPF-701]|nr:unnamed protein product [Pedinophyceae sp. YPF-701]
MSENNVFRGSPGIPHVSEEFFKALLCGSLVATTLVSLPGRFFVPEVRPRPGLRMSRDHMRMVTEQAAQRREEKAGKAPTVALHKPVDTSDSHEKRWHRHFWWRRWHLHRSGPAYPSL